MVKIYLDKGHGGTDGGAQGNGLSEKVLNSKIVDKMNALLKDYKDAEVKLSRTSDATTKSLKERTDEANKWGADVLVSVHINSANSTSANGFESFIWNGTVGPKTIALQNVMHQEIMSKIKGVTDRGKKRANFHMLRESKMEAILTENLFIVNKGDSDKLKQDSFLDSLAQGHVNGLVKFYGLEKKVSAPTPAPATAKRLYKVQIGAFSDYENAKALSEKAKKDGYNTYIEEQ